MGAMQLSFGPQRVLMICLGNICRSPLAEGILVSLARARGIELVVDSAGTNGLTGSRPDPRSSEVARLNGILLQHTARKLTRSDFKNFDHILVMDRHNLTNTLALAGSDEERAKVKIVTEFDPRPARPAIVEDPYYGEMRDFHAVYEQLVHCLNGWLDHHYRG